MKKFCKTHSFRGHKFVFSYEFDPLINDYRPHITVRRNFELKDAFNTYFSITHKIFNIANNRWEAYSETTKPGIYYKYIDNNQRILVMSLFTPDQEDFYKKLKIRR